MYIEASAPRKPGDRATLLSSKYLKPTTAACVTFWYHMMGTNVGTLAVLTRETGSISRLVLLLIETHPSHYNL